MNYINLVKINVGSSSVKDVKEWQTTNKHKWPDGLPRHITRMWPKREMELLAGGSIYWVIKGYIMARQKITGMEEYHRQRMDWSARVVVPPRNRYQRFED